MIFADIPVGTFILFNNKYAVKSDNTHVMTQDEDKKVFYEIPENANVSEDKTDETGK